ncbi:MAG: alanine racemase [Chloroflexota bacterium]|nr:alanine racemase [Chloroflexota bacterium]
MRAEGMATEPQAVTATRSGHESRRRPHSTSPCWSELDLGALGHNVRVLSSLSPPGTKLMAVVKADAYGHGAAHVSYAALAAGAWGLAVARVQEGVELRLTGIRAPILVLGYAAEPELPQAVAHDLAVTVSSWQAALGLAALGDCTGRVARLHLKVDTGMRRYGVMPEDAPRFVEALRGLSGARLEGVYTHFATADEPGSLAYHKQAREFDDLIRRLQDAGARPPLVHAANSAAAVGPLNTSYDLLRAGIALYGVQPSNAVRLDLQPVMSLKARVGRVLDVHAGDGVSYGHDYLAETDGRAAVVTCGYADGYMRSLGNGKGEVLIGGRRCPVLGRVCMDSLVVGLPDGLEVAEGSEVVLLGPQADARVSAEELAERAGTIAYELLCGMGRRSERLYVG